MCVAGAYHISAVVLAIVAIVVRARGSLFCLAGPRFCRQRFYGENELYQHMHAAHEQCFLCKRANPNRFVYFRDYPDLESEYTGKVISATELGGYYVDFSFPLPEWSLLHTTSGSGHMRGCPPRPLCCFPDADHFRQEHHLCPHPNCLENKFVVFVSESELRQHTAREHGDTLSKAEKRQALTLPVNFSVRGQSAKEGRVGRVLGACVGGS